jgi:hypothetical protein
LNGESGKDIPYLPKIFECYLKGLSSNFNPSANVWRQGGSPIETDVTVEFIESRALTYDDIKSLEARAFQEGDFARMYGGGGVESGSKDTINSSATTSTPTPTTTETTTETRQISVTESAKIKKEVYERFGFNNSQRS